MSIYCTLQHYSTTTTQFTLYNLQFAHWATVKAGPVCDNSLHLKPVELTSQAAMFTNRLIAGGLRAQIPCKKPYLNVKQRSARVQWAKQHVHWEKEDWEKVLFSYEVRISIFGSDGIRYVRCRVGEAGLPECLIPTMKHPVSVMVWGCMSRSHVGRLQILEGIVNADKYISSVLEPKLLSLARDIFGQDVPFIFQHGGCLLYTSPSPRDGLLSRMPSSA